LNGIKDEAEKSKFGVRTSKSGIFGICGYGQVGSHSRGDNEGSLMGYWISMKVEVPSSNFEIRHFRDREVWSNEYSFKRG